MTEFKIGSRVVGDNHPVYFIAEIGANHDGDFGRAVQLIRLAKESGADAVKFQHYRADYLASKYGFDKIANLAHYSDNPHIVFSCCETPWRWTSGLKAECDMIGIEFMSTPYDLEAVDHLDPYVNAFKIGSGDITYEALIRHVARKSKPIILSTGASDFKDVSRAMKWVGYKPVCLMQCNTNYTSSEGNYSNLNLKVLVDEYQKWFDVVLGLSDHNSGVAPVLGAVALGAKIIERHFTDDRSRSGPDHGFASDPRTFAATVTEVRRLEAALGDGIKTVEANEAETVVLQRRCLRAARDLKAGAVLTADDIVALRPAPEGSLRPTASNIAKLIDRKLIKGMLSGEEFADGCAT